MKKNLQQFGILHIDYSITEHIVLIISKNSSKQAIRSKNIQFRYKNFVMCSDDGYPYFVDPYCGKKYGGGKKSKNLSVYSVLDCVTEIDDWSNKEVFFDNWFLSFSLISILKECVIPATGTICVDQLGKDLKINKKDLKHQNRSFIQTFYTK